MAKPIVGSMSEWSGLLKDFFRQVDDGSLSLFNLRAFVGHQNPFDYLVDIDWSETYKVLGMEAEYAEATKTLKLPERNDPSLWFLPMAKGVTSNKVVAGHKSLGVNTTFTPMT